MKSHDSNKIDDSLFERKIDLATTKLQRQFYRRMINLPSKINALAIADFILTMKTEANLSDNHRANYVMVLSSLSSSDGSNKRTFLELNRQDILTFLNNCRKPDNEDRLHKWIGTYNVYRSLLLHFFRWLYYPDVEPGKRPKPTVMENIPQLKRKEQSAYKPTDIWSLQDNIIFLKYCPSKRDRCYHTMAYDLSSRPHELLDLRIKDILFKITSDGKQYAEVLVNGKTGSRPLPLINSIPYVKDWLESHPQRGNPNAPVICGIGKSLGRRIQTPAINKIYSGYKTKIFPKILTSPNIAIEDKQKIEELLKKPWNPYIIRHSALTQKSAMLKEHTLRQHAGWSKTSQMHLKYIHYFGNESNESILEAYGIVTKDKKLSDALKPKQCPNCNEPNKPDSKFCVKCRMVLTYDAYNETVEEKQDKDREVQSLKDQMRLMQDSQTEILALLKEPAKLMAALNEK